MSKVNKGDMDKMVEELLTNTDEAYSTEIPDDSQVHLTDNDATIEMADRVAPGPFEDDFLDEMRKQGQAYVGPGGEVLDDFDQKFQMQQGAHQELHSQASFTRINPVSVLKGVLGGQTTVTQGQDPITVAYWVGEDAESLPVTITLGPVNSITVSGGFGTFVDAYAVIQFGTRGFLVTAEVDIAKGCQFTISGSMVTIQVGLNKNNPGTLTAQLAGMLSFYPIVRTAPLTRTLIHDDFIGGAAFTLTVPAFAKNVSLWRSNTGTGWTLDFVDANGTVIYTVTLAGGTFMFDPIPLSGDVVSINATPGAPGTYHSRFIFGLDI